MTNEHPKVAQLASNRPIRSPCCSYREALLKGMDQYGWPLCTNTFKKICFSFSVEKLPIYFTKQAILMRRSTGLSLPLQLVLPGWQVPLIWIGSTTLDHTHSLGLDPLIWIRSTHLDWIHSLGLDPLTWIGSTHLDYIHSLGLDPLTWIGSFHYDWIHSVRLDHFTLIGSTQSGRIHTLR